MPRMSASGPRLSLKPVHGFALLRFFTTRYTIIIGFFFQAEDGIRDIGVTGVKTCALPICCMMWTRSATRSVNVTFCSTIRTVTPDRLAVQDLRGDTDHGVSGVLDPWIRDRSEERRVGKECRDRWIRTS